MLSASSSPVPSPFHTPKLLPASSSTLLEGLLQTYIIYIMTCLRGKWVWEMFLGELIAFSRFQSVYRAGGDEPRAMSLATLSRERKEERGSTRWHCSNCHSKEPREGWTRVQHWVGSSQVPPTSSLGESEDTRQSSFPRTITKNPERL